MEISFVTLEFTEYYRIYLCWKQAN